MSMYKTFGGSPFSYKALEAFAGSPLLQKEVEEEGSEEKVDIEDPVYFNDPKNVSQLAGLAYDAAKTITEEENLPPIEEADIEDPIFKPGATVATGGR